MEHMDHQKLEHVAKMLSTSGKGLLAADESNGSCQKRFDAVGVECTPATRREYRQLLLTTSGAEQYLNGVILFDETFWQKIDDEGEPFRHYLKAKNIMPGIKVDKGLVDLPGFAGEKVTQGLDGLPEQMAHYDSEHAGFAKWRALIAIGDVIPTDECIGANSLILARYARICQDAGIVPIVEPEVLYDGNHTAEQCEQTVARVYDTLIQTLRAFRVHLPGVILKTSMVLPGKTSGQPMNADEVADRTCRVFYDHLPDDLGGIVFLSGGQTPSDAFINLNRIAQRGPHKWGITFSYSRALQDPVLKAWAANRGDIVGIQQIFHRQLQLAAAASKGELDESQLEHDSFVSRSQD